MCGLIGWWSPIPRADMRDCVGRGLTALTPRGPDSGSSWFSSDHRVGLGHRRLAITGLRGNQPLWSPEEDVAILVNGEFYDADRLRHACAPYPFSSDSDSELLLPLYLKYRNEPERLLDVLHGEFAFVLWDRRFNRVWAVRDPAGVKPLRWCLDAQGLRLASEAKALLASGWAPAWSQDALAEAVTLQYPHPHATPFEGVANVGPGESQWFQQDEEAMGGWRVEAPMRYASWFVSDACHRPTDPSGDLEQLLMAAVRRRVETPWPLAVHLSGGLDSSAILAAAVRLRPADVHAFTVQFEDVSGEVQHNESACALQTATHLNVPLTRVSVSRLDLLEHWSAFIRQSEGWAINGHGVAKWLLNREISRQGYRVSLTGEGADEVLLGYPFLQAEMPDTDPAQIASRNPVSRGIMLPEGKELDLSSLRATWADVPVWLRAKASFGAQMGDLLDPDWQRHQVPRALARWQAPQGLPVHPARRAAATWAERALGGYILPTLADGTEAGFGIEGRLPFLDVDLRRAVMAWDPNLSFKDGLTKAPLRGVLRRWGLGHVVDRPKHPFQAPPLWSHPAVRAQLRAQWSDPAIFRRLPAFSGARVVAWMDRLDQGSPQEHQRAEPVVAMLLSLMSLSKVYGL